jgi:hypothetical protein
LTDDHQAAYRQANTQFDRFSSLISKCRSGSAIAFGLLVIFGIAFWQIGQSLATN